MKQHILYAGFLSFLCSYGWAAEHAVPRDWKTECIGRYQLSLPGDVEVAVVSPEPRNQSSSGILFSNGDGADESRFYVDGRIEVGSTISNQDFENYKNKTSRIKNERLKLKFSLHKDGKGFNEDWSVGASTSRFAGSRMFEFEVHSDRTPEGLIATQFRRDDFLKSFEPRQIFTAPSYTGICFPFGFIKDDGEKYRNIAVAMRLNEHPDVEIFFEDQNAIFEDERRAPQFIGSRGYVENFWSIARNSIGNLLQGSINPYHDIKLAGYDGKYAFATIARPDNTPIVEEKIDTYPYYKRIERKDASAARDGESDHDRKARIKKEIENGDHPLDYGFMAYYKGDPKKKTEPDLMLYVIRTASRATAVNKIPLSEEELKKMALEIAASIQLRPTK